MKNENHPNRQTQTGLPAETENQTLLKAGSNPASQAGESHLKTWVVIINRARQTKTVLADTKEHAERAVTAAAFDLRPSIGCNAPEISVQEHESSRESRERNSSAIFFYDCCPMCGRMANEQSLLEVIGAVEHHLCPTCDSMFQFFSKTGGKCS